MLRLLNFRCSFCSNPLDETHILGTSEKYISMLERGQREFKPIRRAYEAWVEAGLPLDWDRQAFEAERKMDSKKDLAI